MVKNLKTIYEYLGDYTEQEIDYVINNLSDEEKLLIRYRYGDDLHNPETSKNWNRQFSEKFYGLLIPKMRRLLVKESAKKETKEKSFIVESKKIETIESNTIQEPKRIIVEEPTIETIDYMSLLNLLNEGKSNTEICNALGINSCQLYAEILKLRNEGINCLRKYYSNGTIKYKTIRSIDEMEYFLRSMIKNERTIITDEKENKMKLLLISDLHIGNAKESLDLINKAFNYCVKEGIYIILCGGDIIDGVIKYQQQIIADPIKQVEHFLDAYPHDDGILTFAVAGNHDLSALNSNSSINIIEACNNNRHDIIIGAYGNSVIKLKNDKILLHHKLDNFEDLKTTSGQYSIIINGHSHSHFTASFVNGTLRVILSPLLRNCREDPTIVKLELSFTDGLIDVATLSTLYYKRKFQLLTKSWYDIGYMKSRSSKEIANVESYMQEQSFKDEEEIKLKLV